LLDAFHRVPDVPTDPHGDSNSNGYTNLEEWLYTLNPMAGLEPELEAGRYSLYPNPSTGSFPDEKWHLPGGSRVQRPGDLPEVGGVIKSDHYLIVLFKE